MASRPLPSSINPHFQNEARCTTFRVKMSFICMRMKNDFHIGLQSTITHFARETGSVLSRIALWACFGTLTPLSLTIGHFRVPPGLRFKTRVGAQPLIWKCFFILMQIKLTFTKKVVHLASFWKWGFLELGSGLLQGCAEDGGKICPPRQSHKAVQHNSDSWSITRSLKMAHTQRHLQKDTALLHQVFCSSPGDTRCIWPIVCQSLWCYAALLAQ